MKRLLWLAYVGLMVSPLLAGEPKLRNTLKGHSEAVSSVAWNPDGKTLASSSADGTIKLWNVASGKCSATLKARPIDYELSDVTSVAWSPNGKTLASGSYDKTIRLWDVASGKNIATFKGHTEWVDSVTWSPDGKTLASVSDGAIKLWDVSTGKNTATLKGHQGFINSVAWSPNGKTLASGDANGVIRVWNVASGKQVASIDGEDGENVLAMSYSPDGKSLASGNGCMIGLWDMTKYKNIDTLEGHSSDLVVVVHGKQGRVYVPAVKSVAFTADGKTLASGSQDKTIRHWDVASGKCIAILKNHSDSVNSVAWSPDGKTLASASDDKTIKLWDVKPDKKKTGK
jgi:WD40 repeat protein